MAGMWFIGLLWIFGGVINILAADDFVDLCEEFRPARRTQRGTPARFQKTRPAKIFGVIFIVAGVVVVVVSVVWHLVAA